MESECRQALKKAIAEADLKREIRENDLAYDPNMKLDEWAEICFSNFFIKQKPQTINEYKILYKINLHEELGRKRIGEIRRADIQTILNRMSEHGYSCSRIKNTVQILNKIYNFAIQEHLIEKSPVKNINKNFGVSPKERVALSEKQIQQFLVEAYKGRSKHYVLAALIALNTGLRAGEILALTWSDFTDDFRFVHINKTVTNEKILSMLQLYAIVHQKGQKN